MFNIHVQPCLFSFTTKNSPPATQLCLVWPPACGGADTPGTSPCSAQPPCEDAASAPPPLSEARPLLPTPLRCWVSSPHLFQHPGTEGNYREIWKNYVTLSMVRFRIPTDLAYHSIEMKDGYRIRKADTDHFLLRSAPHAV